MEGLDKDVCQCLCVCACMCMGITTKLIIVEELCLPLLNVYKVCNCVNFSYRLNLLGIGVSYMTKKKIKIHITILQGRFYDTQYKL